MLIFLLSLPALVLSFSCKLNVVECCSDADADAGSARSPSQTRCFEVNGCPGLYWHGDTICMGKTTASAVSGYTMSYQVEILYLDDTDRMQMQTVGTSYTTAGGRRAFRLTAGSGISTITITIDDPESNGGCHPLTCKVKGKCCLLVMNYGHQKRIECPRDC